MSRRNKLAKEINVLEAEIRLLEIKRSRSMASLMESLISRSNPDETDAQFFRTYTAEIEVKREQLQKMTKELESLI